MVTKNIQIAGKRCGKNAFMKDALLKHMEKMRSGDRVLLLSNNGNTLISHNADAIGEVEISKLNDPKKWDVEL